MNNKEKAYLILKKYYGYTSFNNGQLEIIENILRGRDVFCQLPTGGGKSICYQIPAIIMSGITIVISPLISLMKDQVDNLNEIGIEGRVINSTLSKDKVKEIVEEGILGLYKILYITPERLESTMFRSMIKDMNISLVAVDEAHCVSAWGHDFRKSYLNIKPFIENLKNRPVIAAFTATANLEVREDTVKLLGLNHPYKYIGDINRDNLKISILKEVDKLEELKDIIKGHEEESGIVYCLSKKEVDQLYYYLRDLGYNVGKYHAGLEDREKEAFQDSYLNEEINLMIATNAFGMGIDKSNIRYVVHFTIPKNIESYYQEIGRGGRDGLLCDCHMFYSESDISRVEFLINKSSSINRREIYLRKLESIINLCKYDGCYRSYILRYFDPEDKREFCNSCSNCLNSDELRDLTKESQMILSTVVRTRERFGVSVLVDILRGIKGPKINSLKLYELSTFGIMKSYSTSFIKEIIKGLINLNYVSLKEGTYSMLKINERSVSILKGNEKVLLKIEHEDMPLDNKLFQELKIWRRNVANREGIRPYIIFSDSTLIQIVNNMPKTLKELMNIRGVGEKKISRYGEEILKILCERT